MAVIETWFEQDLQKPVKVRYIDGNLFSHNGNGNRIGVIVTNNGDPVTLTGTVSGYAVLADGTTVPCTGSISGNKASILVPAAAYSPGSILISIFLTDGTTVTTLAALSSSVIMARTGNQIDPGSVVTDWTNTINAAMQSVETAAANLGNIIATPYENLPFPVPLGKYTIYNNGLYRCISPIASSEAWTAAHWTNVKLGDDVADLKSAIFNNLDLSGVTVTSGGFIQGTNGAIGNSSLYSYTDYIDISAFANMAIIIASTLYGTAGFACYDENNTYIANSGISGNTIGGGSGKATSYKYLVPPTAKYIRFSLFNSQTSIADCFIASYASDVSIASLMERAALTTIASTATAFSGDFNDLTDNLIKGFSNTTNATNKPYTSNDGGTIIVLRGVTGYTVTTVQIFIRQNGAVYQRIMWGSGWTAWNELTNMSALQRAPLTREGSTAIGFSGDFDTLTDNQIFGITSTTGATHKPYNDSNDGGTLVVMRGATGYAITAVQIFIRQTGVMYYRILWGTGWTEWKDISDNSGNYDIECYYASLSQFAKIGVIGDSYASGWMYYNGVWQENYPLSWGQNLARRNGVSCVNFSKGGLTTKTWLTDAKGLSLLNSTDAQNLYFIALGLNDQTAINGGTYTLGDSTDYENKTDTFYGNYATIIDAIKNKAPNAKIILCTVSEGNTTTFAQVSNAIKAIGTLASLPVIDVTTDSFMTSSFFNNSLASAHPTAASYSGYAMMIERLFSKCCVDNYAYFKDYSGT